MQKTEKKKDAKRSSLLEAAYDLFSEKGIPNTTIDDIVKRAGVAKGTFYLYFQDKYQLLNQLILHKSAAVIKLALNTVEETKKKQQTDFKQDVYCFIDCLLEYFSTHKDMLQLIHKNLSKGLFRNNIVEDENLQMAVQRFTENFMKQGQTQEQSLQVLYILVEMAGSVCCDAILYQQPYALDEIKPTLYFLIGKLLC